jgi:hypothetical protein
MSFINSINPTAALVGGFATTAVSEYFGISNPVLAVLGASAGGAVISKLQDIYQEQKDILPGTASLTILVDNLQDKMGVKFYTVIVNSGESVIFNKIKAYILDRYSGLLTQGSVSKTDNINISLDLSHSLFSRPIYDHFEGERLILNINRDTIKISSRTLNVEKIKGYIKHLLSLRLGVRKINVHQPVISPGETILFSKDKKKDEGSRRNSSVKWNTYQIQTNKNFSNTILTAQVQKDLVDDLEKFAASEDYYNAKGLPYKRGYLLHGPPGTGKTSIIKAIASFYGMDIFVINMGDIESEQELSQVFQGTRTCDGYHMLCFEDIDRCEFLDTTGYYGPIAKNKGMVRAFLNELDGVIETPKRITVLTANDKTCIEKIAALVRPGRIDKKIHLDFCNTDQLNRLFNHFSDCKEELKLESLNKQITPAQVVKHVILNPAMTPDEFKKEINIIADIEVKERALTQQDNGRRRRRYRNRRGNTPVQRKRYLFNQRKRDLKRLQKLQETLPTKIEKAEQFVTKSEAMLQKSIEVDKKRKERERVKKRKARERVRKAKKRKLK